MAIKPVAVAHPEVEHMKASDCSCQRLWPYDLIKDIWAHNTVTILAKNVNKFEGKSSDKGIIQKVKYRCHRATRISTRTAQTRTVGNAPGQWCHTGLDAGRGTRHGPKSLINQLVETTAARIWTEDTRLIWGYIERSKILKIRINVIESTVEPFNPMCPGEWIPWVKKPLQTHDILWKEDNEEQITASAVSPKMRGMLDYAVTMITEKNLTISTEVWLWVDHKSFPVAQMLVEDTDGRWSVTDPYLDQSGKRQDELWALPTKSKIHKNCAMADYITTNRILQNDMIVDNCVEIVDCKTSGSVTTYLW